MSDSHDQMHESGPQPATIGMVLSEVRALRAENTETREAMARGFVVVNEHRHSRALECERTHRGVDERLSAIGQIAADARSRAGQGVEMGQAVGVRVTALEQREASALAVAAHKRDTPALLRLWLTVFAIVVGGLIGGYSVWSMAVQSARGLAPATAPAGQR